MKKRLTYLVSATLLLSLTFGMSYVHIASASEPIPGTNYLVSQSATNTYANGPSSTAYVSGDGEYVAFLSSATNLVSGVTSGYQNIYVKDTSTGAVTLASINLSGDQFDESNAKLWSISYSGNYVLFSEDLAGSYGDGNLYVFNLSTDTTTKVPADNLYGYGSSGGGMSGDGRYVISNYLTYPGDLWEVVLSDLQTGVNKVIMYGTAYPGPTGVSCDGNIISIGGDIVSFDESGNVDITSAPGGDGGPVSCDGNTLLYGTGSVSGGYSTLYEYNRLTDQSTEIYGASGGSRSGIFDNSIESESLSGDGRYVAFTTDGSVTTSPTYSYTGASYYYDTYLYDVKTGTKQLISFTAAGNHSGYVDDAAPGNVSISGDASTIAYEYQTPSSTNTSEELISGLTTGTSSTQDDIYTSQTGL